MASKGKGKEKEKQPSAVQTAQDQQQEKEVVPGKLTESQWLHLLQSEDAVDVASRLVEETVEVAFSIFYSHHLQQQSFPFTVEKAKHSLLQIIEWQFLSRDMGEEDTNTDPSWIEDEEPTPSRVDSWARGVVPLSSLESLQSAIEIQRPPTTRDTATPPKPPATTQTRPVTMTATSSHPAPSLPNPLKAPSEPSTAGSKPTVSRRRPVAARRSQVRMLTLPNGPISASSPSHATVEGGLNNQTQTHGEKLTGPPGSCTPTSSLPTPSHSTPPLLPYGWKPAQLAWQKEVTYDRSGTIVDMLKLDPTKFPSHW